MGHLPLNHSSVLLSFIGHLHQFSLHTMHCSGIFGCQSHLLFWSAFLCQFLSYLLRKVLRRKLLIWGHFLLVRARISLNIHIFFYFPSLSTFSLILTSPICFLCSSEELFVNSHHSSSRLHLISDQSFFYFRLYLL